MDILPNFSLKDKNTFGIDVLAKQYVSITSEEDLLKVLKNLYASELFILGGGSNILLTKEIEATVLHINLKGKTVLRETDNEVFVRANAGENWHEFVLWCLAHNFGGVENLSLIPGNVGTSPMQNIGAYGVELKDVFVECEAIHIQTSMSKTFTLEDCNFGYRESVFKKELKGQYIITSVVFKLTKHKHKLHTAYGAILSELDKNGIKKPSIQDVSNAVIKIRTEKLPNPSEIGNSGSFFKNPIISIEAFQAVQEKFPEIPYYKVSEKEVKVPAGWLIDQAGYKGYRKGDAGVHKNQALVLVNYGKASGEEILQLARQIQDDVKKEYGIQLETEVNILP